MGPIAAPRFATTIPTTGNAAGRFGTGLPVALARLVDARNRLLDVLADVRLAQEGNEIVPAEPLAQIDLVVAAGDDDGQVRVERAQLADQDVALAVGQADVDDGQVDLSVDQPDLVDRLGCRSGRLDAVAQLLQMLDR